MASPLRVRMSGHVKMPGMGMLDGELAIVTGGARGIGRAAALRMVEEGATVAVVDIDESGAAQLTAATGHRDLRRRRPGSGCSHARDP